MSLPLGEYDTKAKLIIQSNDKCHGYKYSITVHYINNLTLIVILQSLSLTDMDIDKKSIMLPMYIQQSLVPWPYVHSLHIETQGTQTCPGPISQKTG